MRSVSGLRVIPANGGGLVLQIATAGTSLPIGHAFRDNPTRAPAPP